MHGIMNEIATTSIVHQNSERRERPFMFSRLFAALSIASPKFSVGDAFENLIKLIVFKLL